jgi:hypothetical protein
MFRRKPLPSSPGPNPEKPLTPTYQPALHHIARNQNFEKDRIIAALDTLHYRTDI